MEKSSTTVNLTKLAVAAARIMAGDMYTALKQAWNFRKVIAYILIGVLLFIIMIGALIVSLPILIIKAIVPEPLQAVAKFALDVLWKVVSFVFDVVTWIIDAIGNVIQFFFGESSDNEKNTEVNGEVQIDPIPVIIIYNIKYGKGYFDSEDIDEEKFKEIAKLFSDFSEERTTKEVMKDVMESNPGISPDEAMNITKKVIQETLSIDITNHDFEEVLDSDKLGLTDYQKTIALNMYEVYKENPSYFEGLYSQNGLVNEISQEILSARLSESPTIKRADIISAANSVLDSVPYFWGGKSSAIGRDPDWATWTDIGWDSTKLQKVTAPGSPSTGQMRPYGLDCSGFVAWVYHNAGFDLLLNGGTSYQWSQSYSITEGELQPGDLAFENPGSMDNNHVGIFIGHDSAGKNLYIHSSPYISIVTNHNGVTKDGYSGFRYFRRVIVNFN